MSRFQLTRRTGLLAGAAAGVVTGTVLGVAAPAAADVSVSPPSAPQGSGANLYFTVTNDGSAPITQVKLALPPDTPVAEVYPLSVDDWAPRITQRKLTTALTTIHGGNPVTETAKDITWTAVGAASIAPGGSAELGVAIGPLPTLSTMRFPVTTKLRDGTAGPVMPPAELILIPAAAGPATTTHGGHGGATAAPITPAEEALFENAVQDRGTGLSSIAGWVVAILTLAAAGRRRFRGRRNPPAAAEHAPREKELVTAGAPKVTTWSYRDR